MRTAAILPLLVVVVLGAAACATAPMTALPDNVKWVDHPAFPGVKLAVLYGNPSQPGPFVVRLWFPANYQVPPHFHPVAEHVTIIQGTFLVGMGDQLDPSKFSELPTGTFGVIPPGMKHFARAKGEVVLQLHGTGPWGLTYVNPADDPRRRTNP